MMRRTTTALGAVAAAAALAFAAPGTAYAAHGFLIVDGTVHHDPGGCYPLGDYAPPVVTNGTDSVVAVWSGTFCTGRVEWLIGPGETYRPNGNRSVFVP
ncbi:hypothetical protein AB0P12_26420 [Streptomyces subrutilus]|nr:hypothetical protein [Streptomyces subrutilus]WSJ27998.1 hypothetical protein OG479_01125 [Streptomyces subrutilus]